MNNRKIEEIIQLYPKFIIVIINVMSCKKRHSDIAKNISCCLSRFLFGRWKVAINLILFVTI